jgi:DNA replication protein DnaC
MINGLEKIAAESIKAEQGDYIGDDGLLICGKCHTPKQTRCVMPWGVVTPMCICKCKAEQNAEEERQRKCRAIELEYRHQQINGLTDFELLCWIDRNNSVGSEKLERERLAILKRLCFEEPKMQTWTFENAEMCKAIEIAHNYVEQFDKMKEDGKGLLFFGKTGTGKSYTGACIANVLTDRGIPCLMTNFATIRNTAQGLFEGRAEYFKSFNKFQLLVIDDLWAEGQTEYMQEIVYAVINSRFEAGLPLIVTSNITSEQIKHPADISSQRVLSRLYQMCIPFEVEGKDHRRESLKTDFTEYKDLLGI